MSTADREIVITRTFNAPPDLVFEAWTRPEHVDRWMGPRGFVTTTHAMDVRVGGEWRYQMVHPQHGFFPNRVRYREVVPGERLVYDHDRGEGDPNGFHVTVTFSHDGNGGTKLVMRSVFPTAEACEAVKRFGAVEGGNQTLDRLGEHLAAASELDLVLVRTFDAPRSVVWKAWTEAEHLARWWGPTGLKIQVARHDLRPGGLFHYAMIAPDGHPMAGTTWGRKVYREIAPEERIAWINSFSDEAGGLQRHPLAADCPLEILNVASFSEEGGKTTLTLRGRPVRASEADMRTFVSWFPSMRQGYGGTLDRLEAYLAEVWRAEGQSAA